MYLSRFGVKNYKCLGEIDIPLTPIHVLIGENDAGKTSLLEAMGALYGSAEKPLSDVFSQPWEGLELVRHGASDACITLKGVWREQAGRESAQSDSTVEYGFRVGFPTDGRACRISEEYIELDGTDRRVLPVRNPRLTSIYQQRRAESSPSVDSVLSAEALSGILRPAHKYALDAKEMSLPAAFDTERRFAMDHSGFGLATLLDDILGHDPELFIQLRYAFHEFFPQFASVGVKTEMAVARSDNANNLPVSAAAQGKGIFFETRSGQTIRARQASDGAILFLGFLALAHLPDPPTLLLIEEPENGIYPKRLGQVITLLKELVYRTEGVRFPQIIMTTHSPYVASFFEPEEVTFMSRRPGEPDGPVRARPMRDAPNIQERLGGEFYLGELWYNLSEEDLFGEP